MFDQHREKLGIPESHSFEMVESSNKVKHGWDTDIDVFEQRDPDGNVVARYRITDATNMYPPQKRKVDYERIG
ncbi:hypothetical protein HZU72_17505 [Halomonas sp. QX-2]|uniref:Uncharacterized protein n=1 Tax=Vreelandella sedimenti TaxID=2729618 RepID=A0A7Z0SNV1_9GAMM|nr:hypothetical protein [Halomonas sedimenti]NYT74210.1 hypothetical protein [Halomonas sedimenti]